MPEADALNTVEPWASLVSGAAGTRIFDNFAIVTGKLKLKAFSRGRTVEGMNEFSLVIVNTPGTSQVASFQATVIPR